MPTPVGHALAGALIYSLSDAEEASSTKRMTAILACSLLPDVDFLFGWFSGNPNRFHHQFTHSLFFVVFAGLLIAMVLAGRNRVQFRHFSVLFIGAGASHIVLDLLAVDTTAPFGVPLFWPFSHAFFISPVRIFSDVQRASDTRQFFPSMMSGHNLKTVLLEIVILAPWLAWRCRGQKQENKDMDIEETMQRAFIENVIKQEFEQTLAARVERHLKAKPHGIIPPTEFAYVSSECSLLFQDGCFYGCIALSQAVAEAIIKFLCQKNGWKPKKSFEENVTKLQNRQFISTEIKDKFLRIWEKRDDYHHLNSTIETNKLKLESLAYEKILLLKDIESDIFRFSIVDGKLVPENSKYWVPQQNGKMPVFLKF